VIRLKDGETLAGLNNACVDREYKGELEKKLKPVREESFPARLVFERNDFSYVDVIVDPERDRRSGPKGYLPSAVLSALLLMCLKEMRSILSLVRFLHSNPEWLKILNLKRRVRGVEVFTVPDRSTFYKLAGRIGFEGIVDIFARMVIGMMQSGIIKAESVSLDCSLIWAWFKDCRRKKDAGHLRNCRRRKSRDRDASWGYDHHNDRYVYGYKVHVMVDSDTGLPIMLTVTGAGYGENKTAAWFIIMLLKLSVRVRKFFADMAYDSNATRLRVVRRLKAIPFIPLNPRNCKGTNEQEKKARRRNLCLKFYRKNFIMDYWVDPYSEVFDEEYDARTFSEQLFSVEKGSLNLDSLKHKGRNWAMLHSACICIVTLAVAKTAAEIGRPDLMRCIKCFQG